MGKIIGTTASRREPNGGLHSAHLMNMKYTETLMGAGFTPVLIPVGSKVSDVVNILDGIVFTGGADIHPIFYDENVTHSHNPDMGRDKYEIELYHAMKEAGKPIFGICRGLQLIFVAEGFALAQDLYQDVADVHIAHAQGVDRIYPSHFVDFDPDVYITEEGKKGAKKEVRIDLKKISLNDFEGIYESYYMVNSLHHQGIHILDFIEQIEDDEGKANANIKVLGISDDGVVEAMRVTDGEANIFAVQFHPEEMKDFKLFQRCFD